MIGLTHDKLTVLSRTGEKRWRSYSWLCQCQCGKQVKLTKQEILNNKSCGCSKWEGIESKLWKGYKSLSSTVYSSIKANARTRKIRFSISIKYLHDLFEKQGRKCRYTGEKITLPKSKKESYTASLDRIDSGKGYIKGNVQWVHKDVNIMKHDLSDSVFLELCSKIHKHKSK
jgi:hypothetical protein